MRRRFPLGMCHQESVSPDRAPPRIERTSHVTSPPVARKRHAIPPPPPSPARRADEVDEPQEGEGYPRADEPLHHDDAHPCDELHERELEVVDPVVDEERSAVVRIERRSPQQDLGVDAAEEGEVGEAHPPIVRASG